MLHTVVRTHLGAFLQEVADPTDGPGLPRFVEHEFREFLTCGVLETATNRTESTRQHCEALGLVMAAKSSDERDPQREMDVIAGNQASICGSLARTLVGT